MARRLIGTGTTDANGNVIIPYVGTGAGLVNLVAEATIDGSFVSETYSLLDTIFYDKAIDGYKNTKCYNFNSNHLSVTPMEDGTVLECLSSSYWGTYYLNQTNATDEPLTIGTKIEFDVVDVNIFQFQIKAGSTNFYISIEATGHYEIIVDDDYITAYKDGTQIKQGATSSTISSTFAVRFTYRDSSGIESFIKYANFKIYPF